MLLHGRARLETYRNEKTEDSKESLQGKHRSKSGQTSQRWRFVAIP
jgi:hypothetical protein